MLDLKFCYKQQDTDFRAKSIQRSDSKLCIRAFKFKCACFTVLFSTAINSYQCICCSACTLKHAVMHASCDDAFTELYSEMSLHVCGTARSKTVHFSPSRANHGSYQCCLWIRTKTTAKPLAPAACWYISPHPAASKVSLSTRSKKCLSQKCFIFATVTQACRE